MPEWVMPALLQAGFAGVLLFVLWRDGKRNSARDERMEKREESNQGFLRDMFVRVEAQQRATTASWEKLLVGQQTTNTELADEIKALVYQGREVASDQKVAMEKMCTAITMHEVACSRRSETLRQVVVH